MSAQEFVPTLGVIGMTSKGTGNSLFKMKCSRTKQMLSAQER
jgi:hypothetical protein